MNDELGSFWIDSDNKFDINLSYCIEDLDMGYRFYKHFNTKARFYMHALVVL